MRTWLILGLFTPVSAFAGATTPPGGTYYPTIQLALDAADAAGGGTVVVDPGIHVEDITVNDNIVLEGAGYGVTTIQGAGGTNVVTAVIGDLTIQDLTIDANGQRGVEIQSTAGHFVMERTVVTGADTIGEGASLKVSGNTATLTDVEFDGGMAGLGGGAVAVQTGAVLDAVDVQFNGTIAGGEGGSIWASGSDVICDQCVFDGGYSSGDGGAIYAVGASNITVTNSTFTAVESTGGNGGAIALDSASSATLTDITAIGADPAIFGGFLFALTVATPVQIERVRVCGYTAAQGSALYVDGDLNLTNSVFVDNGGSEIILSGNGHIEAVNNHFLSNEGLYAITSAFGTYDIRNGLFAWNTVALQAVAPGATQIADYNLFFSNNTDHLGVAAGPNDIFGIDPLLYDWTDDGDCTNDLPTPRLESMAVDNGDPTLLDPDGSNSDIGAYGGPGADPVLWGPDTDADGQPPIFDCDESNPFVYQGNNEGCGDGLDNDCDGLTDDPSAIDANLWFVDADMDGYGDSNDFGTLSCDAIPGTSINSQDCNDADTDINPAADELCTDNDADSNCDGDPDLYATDATDYFIDSDGDGYGDDATLLEACDDPGGLYVAQGGDCDDMNAAFSPDGIDDTCDGYDQDCSGDEAGTPGWVEYWDDLDGDGYGDTNAYGSGCGQPMDTALVDGDCSDTEPTVNPGAPEICDALDNDCNGSIDDGTPQSSWFDDRDGDGFGDVTTETIAFCPPSPQWVAEAGDCDDQEAAVYPTADEICDGLDNDCNGDVDLDDAGLTDAITGWVDLDGDGYGAGDPVTSCDENVALVDGDCADADPNVNPGVREAPGNDVDEDCDGEAQGAGGGGGGDESKGCACDSGGSPLSIAWLLPALVLLRRRNHN